MLIVPATARNIKQMYDFIAIQSAVLLDGHQSASVVSWSQIYDSRLFISPIICTNQVYVILHKKKIFQTQQRRDIKLVFNMPELCLLTTQMPQKILIVVKQDDFRVYCPSHVQHTMCQSSHSNLSEQYGKSLAYEPRSFSSYNRSVMRTIMSSK